MELSKYISSSDKEEWGNGEINKWKKKRGLIMKDLNSAITTYSSRATEAHRL